MQTQSKTKNLSLTLLLLAMLVLAPAAMGASISTDQEDYAPWEIVTINGSGFDPNSAITLTMLWPDGLVDTFDAMTDDSGGFTVWYGKEKYEGTFTVTATDGTNTATTTFTDATNYNTDITLNAIISPLTAGQTGVSYQGRVSPSTAGNPQVPNGAPVTLEWQLGAEKGEATTTTTSGNGTFSSTFTAPTTGGTYKFQASFKGFTLGSGGSATNWRTSNSGWQDVVVNSPSDTTPPVITITVPADGGVYDLGRVVLADWSATDAESGIASAAGTTVNGAAINTAMVGAKTYTVTAINNAGLTATKTVNYTVEQPDITAPVVSITAPANGGYYKTSNVPVLTYTVTDDTDLDPTVVADGWSDAEGVHTATVTATDHTGKVGWAAVTYTVDNTAPVVTFVPPLSGWFTTSPVVGSVIATGLLL